MVDIRRCEVVWTGLSGLPGVSVFYSDSASDPTGSLATFFNAVKSECPSPLSWQIPTGGDTLDVATGTLTGSWTGTGGTTIAATGPTAHASGTGAFVRWDTPLIVAGRRLRGRTFIAPLASTKYDNDGSLSAACQGILQAAAVALAATGKIGVWHRPTTASPASGAFATATNASCPDRVTSLRTRRT